MEYRIVITVNGHGAGVSRLADVYTASRWLQDLRRLAADLGLPWEVRMERRVQGRWVEQVT
jgi:hypothetical protein